MTDNLTKEQRRKAMQAVKSKDTSLETMLRKALWQKGYRYRKNYKHVIGAPDIAFVSLKIAVFCDSEFWHGYDWSNRKSTIKSNKEYWYKKIERNIERDRKTTQALQKEGWVVVRFWGQEIRKNLNDCITSLEEVIEERKAAKPPESLRSHPP